jgi:hypothetical protein
MAIQCGQVPPPIVSLVGSGGSALPMFVNGTDLAIGGTANQIINMTTQVGNFIPSGITAGGTFLILIETAAPIRVQLADGSNFTISLAYATTYLGDWIPMPVLQVYKTGSTGTFSIGF